MSKNLKNIVDANPGTLRGSVPSKSVGPSPIIKAPSRPGTPGSTQLQPTEALSPVFVEQDKEGSIKLEWGSWTEDMMVTTHEGLSTVQSLENKGTDHAPTARLGLAIPDTATVEWKLQLVSAKGLVSIGLERRSVPLGTAFRKSENRDQVWYYTTDGVLRNGARSVGKKGGIAATRDIVTVSFRS